MQFPVYQAHDMPATSLADAYVRAVADDSADYLLDVPEPYGRLHAVSHDLGAACMTLAHDPPLRAIAGVILDQGRRNLAAGPAGTASDERYRRLLGRSVLPLLDAHGYPHLQEAVRVMQHDTVISLLSETLAMLPEEGVERVHVQEDERDALGDITELTMLALITRLNHPRLMAVPALPHQDKAEDGYGGSANFDIYLFESPAVQLADPGTPETDAEAPAVRPAETETAGPDAVTVHRTQVKAGCLAYCDVPELRSIRNLQQARNTRKFLDKRQAARTAIRDFYTSNIGLVSGCCDLPARDVGAKSPVIASGAVGNRARQTAGWLIREHRNDVRPADVDWLDTVSKGLLLSITSGERLRHGTRGNDYWK